MTIEAPASVGQRLLWLMEHYRDHDGGSLNEPLLWRVRGRLDIEAFRAALTALSQRHEALRTTLATRRRRLTQLVHDPAPVELRLEDLRGYADPEPVLEQSLLDELSTRIDPTIWPVRTRLWRIHDDEYVFSLNMHHLVVDYLSLRVVARNLAALYDHLVTGGPPPPPIGWQYRQWVRWQDDMLAGPARRELEAYWSRTLDEMRSCPIPGAASSDPTGTVTDDCRLEGAVADRLRGLTGPAPATPFAATLSLFYVLVYGATGQDDITVASMFPNRERPEIAGTVGFFENILLLRGRLRPDERFIDVVSRMDTVITEARTHQGLPFHLLPPRLTRSAGGHRPDAVVVNVMRGWPETVQLSGAVVEHFTLRTDHRTARFGLRVVVVDMPTDVYVGAVYSDDRAGWLRGFGQRYATLAARVASAPEITIDELCRT